MTEYRHFKKKRKHYVTPVYEDDYVIESYITDRKAFDWRMDGHEKYFQRHKNRKHDLDMTVKWH